MTVTLLCGLTPSARADVIDDALREEAPKIMKYIKDHGYHTVGVLKFVVKKGNQPASLNTGTLNTKIAKSLEHALILLNDPSKPIDIIQDASKAAAGQSRGATFRSAQGSAGSARTQVPTGLGVPAQAARRLHHRRGPGCKGHEDADRGDRGVRP